MKKEPYYIDQHVRVTDLNYGNHLGLPQVSCMAHNARLCFLKSLGLSEMDIGGCAVMIVASHIELKAESLHGDMLRFFVSIEIISKTKFQCHISVLNPDKDILVATIEDTLVCYDYERKRVVAVPDSFKHLISEVS